MPLICLEFEKIMNYQPEIDPSKAEDFPLEKARMYHLYAGLGALKIARNRMPEEVQASKPEVAVETNVVSPMLEQPTASDNLAEIREQIRREAA